ncbi:hypothetical protein DICVIV_11228 [Dictyocaulus viviparus]|uniref:Secreted protein n=1 Tax=Dictyocaulus viviparus TaxID=29172 RepID=A0A0D8XGA7_DICVI|nr:hypothetical protein DICVIV_11228 [Dictyocaulus viviparus]
MTDFIPLVISICIPRTLCWVIVTSKLRQYNNEDWFLNFEVLELTARTRLCNHRQNPGEHQICLDDLLIAQLPDALSNE